MKVNEQAVCARRVLQELIKRRIIVSEGGNNNERKVTL